VLGHSDIPNPLSLVWLCRASVLLPSGLSKHL
jgi:hypothetical protein